VQETELPCLPQAESQDHACSCDSDLAYQAGDQPAPTRFQPGDRRISAGQVLGYPEALSSLVRIIDGWLAVGSNSTHPISKKINFGPAMGVLLPDDVFGSRKRDGFMWFTMIKTT